MIDLKRIYLISYFQIVFQKTLSFLSYNLLNIRSLGSRTGKGHCFTDKRRYKAEEKSAIYSFGGGVKDRMGRITNSENKKLGTTLFGKFKKYGRGTSTSQRKCKWTLTWLSLCGNDIG